MTASGVISPKHAPIPADRSKTDIWTIDQNRNLVHLNDGTFYKLPDLPVGYELAVG